jgi:superfamily II DNA or RNA helicase
VDEIQGDSDHDVESCADQLPECLQRLTKSRIAIMSDVGTEGLTLTRITRVIVLDGHWSPSLLNQLKGRFVRQGPKTREVRFYYVQTADGADPMLSRISDQKDRISSPLGALIKDLADDISIQEANNPTSEALVNRNLIPSQSE